MKYFTVILPCQISLFSSPLVIGVVCSEQWRVVYGANDDAMMMEKFSPPINCSHRRSRGFDSTNGVRKLSTYSPRIDWFFLIFLLSHSHAKNPVWNSIYNFNFTIFSLILQPSRQNSWDWGTKPKKKTSLFRDQLGSSRLLSGPERSTSLYKLIWCFARSNS